MNKITIYLSFILVLFLSGSLLSQIKLPKLVSDGMVLQRNEKIKIWGWASPGEKISIVFKDRSYKMTTGKDGKWSTSLEASGSGGPYSMEISGSNKITINDILIGDVWVSSGQSNMELPIRRVVERYPDVVANSENNFIRQFLIPIKPNFNQPQDDLVSGNWKKANRENITGFSAIGYFFAKELYEKYRVPIGLISSSAGGTPVEAWISEEALKSFPKYLEHVKNFKDEKYIHRLRAKEDSLIKAWFQHLDENDKGLKDKTQKWSDPSVDTKDWATIKLPGFWKESGLLNGNGVVWLNKEIQVTPSMVGMPGKLYLGTVVDYDSVFINGRFVGATTYQYPPRIYNLPADVLKVGRNKINIRVITNSGNGGFTKDKKYLLVVGKDSIDLKGEWNAKVGAEHGPIPPMTFIQYKPTGLYNGMIFPITSFAIKGVIWYQGESNVERNSDYFSLFSTMINNWRKSWGQGDFPFLFVQLANFLPENNQPSESDWAILREAQFKTLSLPNTGMVVAHDLGEWNDIHPTNKKDVARRLASAAYKVAYKEKIVHSGPLFQSAKIKGNGIELSFSNIGKGLTIKGGEELKYFAVAGADKKFVWAKAIIKGDKIEVWSNSVKNPLYVRYAWADNPEGANLYNKEGFPASSFRTDK